MTSEVARAEVDRPASLRARIEVWLKHIKALAEDIGYRLPGSEGEARAADYCRRVLTDLGLEARVEEFPSIGSVFRPHLTAALLMLAAFVLYPLRRPAGAWAALVLTVFAVWSEIMEITLRPHPLQKALPKRVSRNVFAVVGPARRDGGPASAAAPLSPRDIVVIGHMDSQRTPVIFSSPAWMAAYRVYSTLAFVSFVAQAALYLGGVIAGWTWAWPVSAVSALMAVLLVALTVQAELSPSTHGANDNATAAGLVLTLAEDLVREPLPHSRVWLLCSGSEESLHEGAKSFFARHKGEMTEPRAVALEMLGCAGPAWLKREGFVLPLPSDAGLQRLARRVAEANPDLGAHAAVVAGGVTEMSDAILAGVPAITVAGLGPDNVAPYWHRPSDTVDKMDAAPGGAMERNYRFVRALLAAMDADRPGPATA